MLDSYLAKQVVQSTEQRDNQNKEINMVRQSINNEFVQATSIQRMGRKTLYTTIINNNENLGILQDNSRFFQSPGQSMDYSQLSMTSTTRKGRKIGKSMRWNKQNIITSSNHLMQFTSNFNAQENLDEASNIYIPTTQRMLKYDNRKKKARNLKPLPDQEIEKLRQKRAQASAERKYRALKDSSASRGDESSLAHKSLAASQLQRDTEFNPNTGRNLATHRNKKDVKFNFQDVMSHNMASGSELEPTVRNNLKHMTIGEYGSPNPQKIKKRRESFSLTQTKYEDARNCWHPLKEIDGPCLNDLATIEKMKKAKRYPMPEKVLHLEKDFDLFIDSLMHSAYASDDNEFWAEYRQECDQPANSYESLEQIDFHSSSEESLRGSVDGDNQPPTQHSPIKQIQNVIAYQPVKTKKKKKIPEPLPPDTKAERKYQDKMRTLKIRKDAIDQHGFDLEILEQFPHNMREGDVPKFLLKNSAKGWENYNGIHERILEEFQDKLFYPTNDHIQVVYEYFCNIFKTRPVTILQYFNDDVFEFSNYTVSLNQAKAMSCIIPILKGLKEIKFCENSMSDEAGSLLIMAAFMNPHLKDITFIQNNLRKTCSNTFYELNKAFPFKIESLTLSSSNQESYHIDKFIHEVGGEYSGSGIDKRPGQSMIKLDLSQVYMSLSGCKTIGQILYNQKALKNLDLQNCQISHQGTRFVVDGLNMNQGLEFFNFAENDLSSKVNEYAIKIAKILSRHDELMHMNLSTTGLRKEEVIFIGMALPASKSCIGLHLSGNQLDYYERVFLRTLINAKLQSHFKAMSVHESQKRLSDQNQVSELSQGDFWSDELNQFVKTYQYLEDQKMNVDEDISKILHNVDFVQMFNDIRKGGKTDQASSEELQKHNDQKMRLQDLIDKIRQRQSYLENLRKETERFHDAHIDLQDKQIIENFKTMGLYNKDENGQDLEKDNQVIDLKENMVQNEKESTWLLHNALKIDRIRQRVQVEAHKQEKKLNKTPGEMALMFLGINKVAYDLLSNNPMTPYMSEIIFTRQLGQKDIEGSEIWKDCSQCWICQKWNKKQILHDDDNKNYLKQDIKRLSQLDGAIKSIQEAKEPSLLFKLFKQADAPIEKPVNNQDQDSESEMAEDMVQIDKPGFRKSPSDDLVTESLISTQGQSKLSGQQYGQIHNIDSLGRPRINRQMIHKQLPDNFFKVKSINSHQSQELDGSQMSAFSDDSDLDITKNLPHSMGKTQATNVKQNDNTLTFQKFEDVGKSFDNRINDSRNFQADPALIGSINSSHQGSRLGKAALDIPTGSLESTAVKHVIGGNILLNEATMREKAQHRKHSKIVMRNGEKYRKVEKKVYYNGTAFNMEEEERVDSDEASSVITSDDEFQVDDQVVMKELGEHMDHKQKNKPADPEVQQLDKAMKNKIPKVKSIFGRKQVFICASFNDWIPIELKSTHEIKLENEKGNELEAWIKSKNGDLSELKSANDQDNLLQITSYIPPGQHYFYYIFDRKHIFLSPQYDIVKVMNTNVFFNQITVNKRTENIERVTLERSIQIDHGEMNVIRSVFRTYQEDTDDFVKRLLMTDLKYGKALKLCKHDGEKKNCIAILSNHYSALVNIYAFYTANSQSYPLMDQKDVTGFVYRSKIFDRSFNLALLDRCFIATNTLCKSGIDKDPNERTLHRYEFIDILIRLAYAKYRETKICLNLHESIENLILKDILPHHQNHTLDGNKFRQEFLYGKELSKIHEILKKNEVVIKKLYAANLAVDSRYIDMEAVQKMLKKSNLNLTMQKVNLCYNESLMSRLDPSKDLTVSYQMRYVEFVVFIARIAHQLYKGTKEEKLGKDQKNLKLKKQQSSASFRKSNVDPNLGNEADPEAMPLHEKIDSILDPMLSTIYRSKIFTNVEKNAKQESKGKSVNTSENDSKLTEN